MSAGRERSRRANGSSPSVTVIVPTRERPDLLRRALVSIVGQDYGAPLEVLVVFDQDRPVDPKVELRDGCVIRLLTNDRTPGLAGARNTGIMKATGDLIAFCDDDDEWLPEKLREQVPALMASAATVAATGVEVVFEDRRTTRIPPVDEVTMEMLLRSRMTELHPSTFLARRRELIDEGGLVDETLPGSYGEDYDWLLRAARKHPIVAVRRPLSRVHWHRSSFFSQRWLMIVDALSELLDRYPEFRSDPIGLARIQGQIAFAAAAAGQRSVAREWVRKALRNDWRQRRAYVALAVSLRFVTADAVLRLAHKTGRGI
jgi:glycosyltransferase involved in cell wall biosynthesis